MQKAIYSVVNNRHLFHGMLRAASMAARPLQTGKFLRHLPLFVHRRNRDHRRIGRGWIDDAVTARPAVPGRIARLPVHLLHASAGEWARIRPVRAGGAWEVLARVSRLDLFDAGAPGDPPTPPTPGGRGTNWTVGLTWHITANHKLMVNQAWVDLDERAVPTKPVYGTVPGDQFYYTQARLQIVF